MDVKLNITPEQIDELVRNAILRSALGTKIDEAIKSHLTDWKLSESVNREVSAALSAIIRDVVGADQLLRARIHAAVTEKLTDECLSKLLENVWDRIINKDRY